MKQMRYFCISFALFILAILASCDTSPEKQLETQLPSSSDVETTAIQSENITNAPSNTGILCSNDRYTISFEGNNCYINFSSGNDTSPEEGFSQVGSIDFTSLSEMKNHFTKRRFFMFSFKIRP